MKRLSFPLLCSALLSLLLLSLFVFERRTHAQPDAPRRSHKVSKEILQKIADGQGSDVISVIVQSAESNDSDLESTLEMAGANNIGTMGHLGVRVADVRADQVTALAERVGVAYVSLNREVRPFGHLSLTTGTDRARNEYDQATQLDGEG